MSGLTVLQRMLAFVSTLLAVGCEKSTWETSETTAHLKNEPWLWAIGGVALIVIALLSGRLVRRFRERRPIEPGRNDEFTEVLHLLSRRLDEKSFAFLATRVDRLFAGARKLMDRRFKKSHAENSAATKELREVLSKIRATLDASGRTTPQSLAAIANRLDRRDQELTQQDFEAALTLSLIHI